MTEIPKDFETVFRDVVKVFQPRPMQTETCAMYWSVLGSRFSVSVLRESAEFLARRQRFFPTTAEWTSAAHAVQSARRIDDAVPEDKCTRCGDKGLIRVMYTTGDPFDVAICTCQAAQFYRRMGIDVVRFIQDDLHLGPEHRVAYLEDFDEPS